MEMHETMRLHNTMKTLREHTERYDDAITEADQTPELKRFQDAVLDVACSSLFCYRASFMERIRSYVLAAVVLPGFRRYATLTYQGGLRRMRKGLRTLEDAMQELVASKPSERVYGLCSDIAEKFFPFFAEHAGYLPRFGTSDVPKN
jgi:hypothetical protein